jgi:hypothetical protein
MAGADEAEAVLAELCRAREALRAERTNYSAIELKELPYPFTRRAVWTMAITALASGSRLLPADHALVVSEYERLRDAEAIPPEVAAYLLKLAGPGRPRRQKQAGRERAACHYVWLLWGYYKRRGVQQPLLAAQDAIGRLMNMGPDTMTRLWKVGRRVVW